MSQAQKSECVIPSAKPFVLSNVYTCLPGLYCPFLIYGDNSTFPAMCPPTIDCSIKRLMGGWCSPQGTYEPRICSKGSFCPTPTLSQICPSGSWCPRGSSQPIACEWLSSCPEGSVFRTHWGLLLLCALIDALVISLSFWDFKSLSKLRGSSWRQGGQVVSGSSSAVENEGPCCPLLCNQSPTMPAAPETAADGTVGSVLASGFSKMNRTGSIELRVVDISVQLPGGSPCTTCFRDMLSSRSTTTFHAPAQLPPPASPRNIITHVSAVFSPGRLHAIMGPSGSGKTTLLHCIAGKLDASSGSIFLNSTTPVNPRSVKKCVGFVPQDDVMLRTLTVQEIVTHRCAAASFLLLSPPHAFAHHAHSARVRMGSRVNNDDKLAHVRAVISALGLDNVRYSIVGDEQSRGLSGGERKRLNIGIELAAAPLLLLLDEPTSGLDSSAALELCQVPHATAHACLIRAIHHLLLQVLKSLAQLQLTIVAVIHQPRWEIFRLFDDLTLLTSSGTVAYSGAMQVAHCSPCVTLKWAACAHPHHTPPLVLLA